MFSLSKQERIIVISLIVILLIGFLAISYDRLRPPQKLVIEKIIAEPEDEKFPSNKTVNINTASTEELMVLDGVGRKLAERIVEHRSVKGAFRTKKELEEVKGVGDKIFNAIKDNISLE